MSKIIVLGDTHGRSFWKLILNIQEWDEAIFIGDYFDSYDISSIEQIRNFEDIIAFKKESKKPVTLLIGNHDFTYYPEVGNQNYSGYQAGAAKSIEFLINESRDKLQMAHSIDNLLFTHAGVSETWINLCCEQGGVEDKPELTAKRIAEWVNDVFKFKPLLFKFMGFRDPYGDEEQQTPIWIRPRSLMKASQNLKKQGVIQICGHTQQNSIDIKGKSTGGKYFFIDTLGASGEYLIVTDGIFSVGKI